MIYNLVLLLRMNQVLDDENDYKGRLELQTLDIYISRILIANLKIVKLNNIR
ncbi:hypothetical protein JMUB7495_27520 [Staphylococcus aureus]